MIEIITTIISALTGAVMLAVLALAIKGIQNLIPYIKKKIALGKKQKNINLMEKGYGFLLSEEEREEILADYDIEVLKPFQRSQIIKKNN